MSAPAIAGNLSQLLFFRLGSGDGTDQVRQGKLTLAGAAISNSAARQDYDGDSISEIHRLYSELQAAGHVADPDGRAQLLDSAEHRVQNLGNDHFGDSELATTLPQILGWGDEDIAQQNGLATALSRLPEEAFTGIRRAAYDARHAAHANDIGGSLLSGAAVTALFESLAPADVAEARKQFAHGQRLLEKIGRFDTTQLVREPVLLQPNGQGHLVTHPDEGSAPCWSRASTARTIPLGPSSDHERRWVHTANPNNTVYGYPRTASQRWATGQMWPMGVNYPGDREQPSEVAGAFDRAGEVLEHDFSVVAGDAANVPADAARDLERAAVEAPRVADDFAHDEFRLATSLPDDSQRLTTDVDSDLDRAGRDLLPDLGRDMSGAGGFVADAIDTTLQDIF